MNDVMMTGMFFKVSGVNCLDVWDANVAKPHFSAKFLSFLPVVSGAVPNSFFAESALVENEGIKF